MRGVATTTTAAEAGISARKGRQTNMKKMKQNKEFAPPTRHTRTIIITHTNNNNNNNNNKQRTTTPYILQYGAP